MDKIQTKKINNIQTKWISNILNSEELLSESEFSFISLLASLDKNVELSEKQNEMLNRISQKIN